MNWIFETAGQIEVFFEASIFASIALIYVVVVFITIAAYYGSVIIGALRETELTESLLGMLGGLYTLTAAFLLSYAIFQFATLRTEITNEVATVNKLGTVVHTMPDRARVEARRLVYDYAYSIATFESETIRFGRRSPEAQLAMQRLTDFFDSHHTRTPEVPDDADARAGPSASSSSAYLHRKSTPIYNRSGEALANQIGIFLFELIDAREKRFANAREKFPPILWVAFGIMYFTLAFAIFVECAGRWNRFISGGTMLLSCPLPPVLLYVYSNPFASGLIDLRSAFSALLESSI